MTRAVPATSPSAGVRAIRSSISRLASLGGDGEAAVLDEGAGVDEVGDVLASRAPARGVASLDRVRTRLVLGQRASFEHLGQVLALLLTAAPLSTWHARHVPRRRAGLASSAELALECGTQPV